MRDEVAKFEFATEKFNNENLSTFLEKRAISLSFAIEMNIMKCSL